MGKIIGDDNPHKGHRERLKNRYMANGLDSFEPHEVLELLLFYSVRYSDTNVLSHRIIKEFGSFSALLEAPPREIAKRCKISEHTAILISLCLPMYRKYLNGKWHGRIVLDSSRKVGEYAQSLFIGEVYECLYVICVDNNRRLISPELISRGTVDSTSWNEREILETVLTRRASGVILAHNHPSGIPAVSPEDIETTAAVRNLLKPLDVEVIDHIIAAGDTYISFTEKRLLN